MQVLSWIVVGFRLHTRLRVVREPGWDDLFVVLAAVVNLVAVSSFLEGTLARKHASLCSHTKLFQGTRYGLGHHLVYVFPTLEQTMIYIYVTNAAYHTTTTLIKVSLLLQYLRLFRQGPRRTTCLILLGLVTIWGCVFSFLAWVPCVPVSGFWNKNLNPPAKCYGYGFRDVTEITATLLVFSSTNMLFDIAIFLVPLKDFLRSDLRRKQIFAMMGLFSLGCWCV